MSMNHYWEKYKNRNKSQDISSNPGEKQVPTHLILDQISALQCQVNALETKFLDLNCKFNGLNTYESHNFAIQNPLLEKIERIEKSLEVKRELAHKDLKFEENNNFFRMENLRLELVKELNLTENRISENLSKEVQNINKRIKEISESSKENSKPSKKPEEGSTEKAKNEDWLKKIEKIVVSCGEKLKKLEGSQSQGTSPSIALEIEGLKASVSKFKGFQSKVKRKIDEIEEFSKKLCRKFIESDSLVSSPLSKSLKKDASLASTQKKCKKVSSDLQQPQTRRVYLGYLSTSKTNSKKLRPASPAPKGSNKTKTKLEQLYEELNEF